MPETFISVTNTNIIVGQMKDSSFHWPHILSFLCFRVNTKKLVDGASLRVFTLSYRKLQRLSLLRVLLHCRVRSDQYVFIRWINPDKRKRFNFFWNVEAVQRGGQEGCHLLSILSSPRDNRDSSRQGSVGALQWGARPLSNSKIHAASHPMLWNNTCLNSK